MHKGDVIVTAGHASTAATRTSIRTASRSARVDRGRHERHRELSSSRSRCSRSPTSRSLDSVAALVPKQPRASAVSVVDSAKAAVLLFVAAIMQVSIFAQVARARRHAATLLLVTLVARRAPARLDRRRGRRASSPGCSSTRRRSGTLGLTSLVLTLAGYWIGRYGETTGRDRAHAPFLSVAVVTVLYAFGAPARPLRARRARAGGRDAARPAARRSCSTCPRPRRCTRLVRRLLPPARPRRPRDRGAAAWLASTDRAPARRGARAAGAPAASPSRTG